MLAHCLSQLETAKGSPHDTHFEIFEDMVVGVAAILAPGGAGAHLPRLLARITTCAAMCCGEVISIRPPPPPQRGRDSVHYMENHE